MVVRINKSTSILVYFFLFICLLSSGVVEGFSYGSNTFYSLHKDDGVRIKSRKVLGHEEVVLDYDYPGANPRHDPKKGKPPKNS